MRTATSFIALMAAASLAVPCAIAVQTVPCHAADLSQSDLKMMLAPSAVRYPGALVVGFISPKGKALVAFGKDAAGKLAGGDTVFQIASITKVFSGLLLAQEIESGSITLDQPVDEVVEWRIPRYGKSRITMSQLAEHRSALPDWPTNRGNTSSAYSSAQLQSFLAQYKLPNKPGTDMVYSNAGFALLGDALAAHHGTTFEKLFQKNICQPLGMDDTRITPSPSMQSRRVFGHSARGRIIHQSVPTAGGGADGIQSTANDLLKFVGAYAGLTPVKFPNAIEESYKVRTDADEDNDIGLGWYTRKPEGIVWKGGRIAGYRTYVAFEPKAHVGVVVLAACDSFPSPDVGRKILLKALGK